MHVWLAGSTLALLALLTAPASLSPAAAQSDAARMPLAVLQNSVACDHR